ncbi:hypothetical protein ES702_07365 [subsurface metagenome]
MSNGEIEVFEEMSGVAFEPTPAVPGGLGSVLSDVGGMFGPGGMSLPPMSFQGTAESRASVEAAFDTGDITFGIKSDTLIIGAVVVLGLLILFGGKK